jgi:hypothetical protein
METKTITIEAAFWLDKYDPIKNIFGGKYDFKFPVDWINIEYHNSIFLNTIC